MSGCEVVVPATHLIGANPCGAVARVSLAVRRALTDLSHDATIAVLVGVSGGADSLALGVCAIDVGSRMGLPVHTVSVDHGLRAGSAEEAAEVARRLTRLGAHASTVRVEVAGAGGPEASARTARREALLREARRIGMKPGLTRVIILLGHTMDDQAETVLLRLARGSGARSLRAMAPVIGDDRPDSDDEAARTQVTWVRPLLGVRRADTRACCTALGLEWVEDPTNAAGGPWRAADGSALRRAAIRERALPELAEALGVDPVPALARTADLLASDDDALTATAGKLWGDALVEENDSVLMLSVPVLADAEPAVRGRVLRRAALRVGARSGDLARIHIETMDRLVIGWHGQGPVDLPGARARRREESLVLSAVSEM